jgi:hypothetical protein
MLQVGGIRRQGDGAAAQLFHKLAQISPRLHGVAALLHPEALSQQTA